MLLEQSEEQVGEQETWLVTLQTSREVKITSLRRTLTWLLAELDLEERFDSAIDRLLKRFFSLQMADDLNDRKLKTVTSKVSRAPARKSGPGKRPRTKRGRDRNMRSTTRALAKFDSSERMERAKRATGGTIDGTLGTKTTGTTTAVLQFDDSYNFQASPAPGGSTTPRRAAPFTRPRPPGAAPQGQPRAGVGAKRPPV